MTAEEALRLIRLPLPMPPAPQTWADLGSGQGLFAHALLRQLPAGSQVYAIDRDTTPAPAPGILPLQRDFVTADWGTPPLHGILMANALHFVEQQRDFLLQAAMRLLPGGHFLFVEYDTDVPNRWVPHPLSLRSLQSLFRQIGMAPPQPIHTMPSRYGGAPLYSAFTTR